MFGGGGNGGCEMCRRDLTHPHCTACAPAEGNIVCYLIDVMKYRSEHFANYSSNVIQTENSAQLLKSSVWGRGGKGGSAAHQNASTVSHSNYYERCIFGGKSCGQSFWGAADMKATHNVP